MIRRIQGHIWTRPRCQGALEWNNTLRDRCSHISGLLVKTFQSLRALMKSALPRLITTAASRALYLRRLGGSRSDRSCHQLVHTSHGAEGLLDLSVTSKSCSPTCQQPLSVPLSSWPADSPGGSSMVVLENNNWSLTQLSVEERPLFRALPLHEEVLGSSART